MPASTPTFKTYPKWGVHTQAKEFFQNVRDNGGSLNSTEEDLVADAVKNGVEHEWLKCMAWGLPLLGDSLNAFLTPIFVGAAKNPTHNMGFTDDDCDRTEGLTGDGTKSLYVGMTQKHICGNSINAFGAFVRTAVPDGDDKYILDASTYTAPVRRYFLRHRAASAERWTCAHSNDVMFYSASNDIGLFIVNRTSRTNVDFVLNKTVIASDSTVINEPINDASDIRLFSSQGGGSSKFVGTIGMFFLSYGFPNSTVRDAFFDDMKTLYDGIGRTGI